MHCRWFGRCADASRSRANVGGWPSAHPTDKRSTDARRQTIDVPRPTSDDRRPRSDDGRPIDRPTDRQTNDRRPIDRSKFDRPTMDPATERPINRRPASWNDDFWMCALLAARCWLARLSWHPQPCRHVSAYRPNTWSSTRHCCCDGPTLKTCITFRRRNWPQIARTSLP